MRVYPLIALSAALLGVACVERPTSSFPAQAVEDLGAADMGMSSGDMSALGQGQGIGSLNGVWLRVHEQSSCVLRQEQVSLTDYIVEIEQDGQLFTEQPRICNLLLSPLLGLSITVPAATSQSVAFTQLGPGLISSALPDARYSSPTELGLWGVALDDALGDELPREPDSSMVRDADGDGNPGVSFQVGDSCLRYTVQRQLIHYEGSLVAPNRIEGGSTSVTETVVVGSSKSICNASPTLQPNDKLNRFVMVRIDGQGGAYQADLNGDGEISCDEVRGLGVQLMQARAADAANCR